MAKYTEVLVLSRPSPTQSKGDWIVKVGAGRGGKIISRHRQKARAVKRARREGRKREKQGAVLKIQDADGRFDTAARYGKARKKAGGGFLGLF